MDYATMLLNQLENTGKAVESKVNNPANLLG